MRIILPILTLLATACLYPQGTEEKICDCIDSNFDRIGEDHTQIINEVERDLVKNDIIGESYESRINQISTVAKTGMISQSRTYENILLEQLGQRTLNYCVVLHTYGSGNHSPPPIYRMIRKLESLRPDLQQENALENLRRTIANILLEYNQPSHKDSPLWKIIQLEYLYRFSETQEMKSISKKIEWDTTQFDTSHNFKIHVDKNDSTALNGQIIREDEICDRITPFIPNGMAIHFTNEKGTNYKTYLRVYNILSNCILQLREEKAKNMYGKELSDLSESEMTEIRNLIPFRIVESPPK